MMVLILPKALMTMLAPFYKINSSCDEASQWANTQLLQANLRIVQTFDLHTARHSLDGCPCPHHGTDACDCQMVILLVYGDAGEPVTLILHGYDRQTWVSIAENFAQKTNAMTATAIKNALAGKQPPTASD